MGRPTLNRSGERHGKLVVQELVSKHPPIWKCTCDCGSTVEVPSEYLRHGKRGKSTCGCGSRGLHRQSQRRPFETLFIYFQKCTATTMSFQEFLDFVAIEICHYCQAEVDWSRKNSYHLDRKIAGGPYSKENCVVACPSCNRIKSNVLTYSEMLLLGRALKEIRLARNERFLPFKVPLVCSRTIGNQSQRYRDDRVAYATSDH